MFLLEGSQDHFPAGRNQKKNASECKKKDPLPYEPSDKWPDSLLAISIPPCPNGLTKEFVVDLLGPDER